MKLPAMEVESSAKNSGHPPACNEGLELRLTRVHQPQSEARVGVGHTAHTILLNNPLLGGYAGLSNYIPLYKRLRMF